MKKPFDISKFLTLSEYSKESGLLKTRLLSYWKAELIKPTIVRIRGTEEYLDDPEIIHNPGKLRELHRRYEFYFDKKYLTSRINKIHSLQKEKRWTIREIREYFDKLNKP